jgi:hypothetical protein
VGQAEFLQVVAVVVKPQKAVLLIWWCWWGRFWRLNHYRRNRLEPQIPEVGVVELETVRITERQGGSGVVIIKIPDTHSAIFSSGVTSSLSTSVVWF